MENRKKRNSKTLKMIKAIARKLEDNKIKKKISGRSKSIKYFLIPMLLKGKMSYRFKRRKRKGLSPKK